MDESIEVAIREIHQHGDAETFGEIVAEMKSRYDAEVEVNDVIAALDPAYKSPEAMKALDSLYFAREYITLVGNPDDALKYLDLAKTHWSW